MTPNEFDRWWTDSRTRWPSLQTWLAKCFADESRQVEFLRNWRAVLVDVSLADALEINRQMQCGDCPFVGEYDSDKERLPQHVRRLSRQLAAERNQTPAGGEYERPIRDTDFPAGKLLRRWQELQALGTPRDEAREIALREFPVGSPKWEPRYNCHLCLDVGLISIASNDAIKAMLLGEFDRCHHRIGTVRCKCKGHLTANPKHKIATYEAGLDFKIVDFMWGEKETARFAEWVNVQSQKRSAELAKAAPNYEQSFAAFNQRGAT